MAYLSTTEKEQWQEVTLTQKELWYVKKGMILVTTETNPADMNDGILLKPEENIIWESGEVIKYRIYSGTPIVVRMPKA